MQRPSIVLLALFLLFSANLKAQEADDRTIYCPFGSSPLTIAVPESGLESSIGRDDKALAAEVEEDLREGLVADALFAIRGPADFSRHHSLNMKGANSTCIGLSAATSRS